MRLAALTALAFLAFPSVIIASGMDDLCVPPEARSYPALGRPIGLSIPKDWVELHADALHEEFSHACDRFSKCLTVWGNPVDFCRDLLANDARSCCTDMWDEKTQHGDWVNCRSTAQIYSVSRMRPAARLWPELQRAAAVRHANRLLEAPRVELDPADPKSGEGFDLVVRAWDAETDLPRYGMVVIAGRTMGVTFQKIGYRFQFDRIKDELGRISLAVPSITVRPSSFGGTSFPGFPDVVVPFESPIPKITLTMVPPPASWTVGRNTVRITARDAATGGEIVGSLRAPGIVLGPSSEPVTFMLEESTIGLCGEPVWFRSRLLDHPDASLPIQPCE